MFILFLVCNKGHRRSIHSQRQHSQVEIVVVKKDDEETGTTPG